MLATNMEMHKSTSWWDCECVSDESLKHQVAPYFYFHWSRVSTLCSQFLELLLQKGSLKCITFIFPIPKWISYSVSGHGHGQADRRHKVILFLISWLEALSCLHAAMRTALPFLLPVFATRRRNMKPWFEMDDNSWRELKTEATNQTQNNCA